jgi:hypothetical protein
MRHSVRAEETIDTAGAIVAVRLTRRTERSLDHISARKRLAPSTDLTNAPAPFQTLERRATAWCYPWNIHSYPGHIAGIMAILGKPISVSLLYYWKKTDRVPVWAAERLADYIEARCRVGFALVDELRDHIKRMSDGPPSKTGAHLRGRGSRDRLPD